MSGEEWTTANQRVLVAEFARLRAQIAGEDTAMSEEELAMAQEALPADAAIETLSAAFGLSAFERDVLLLCAGAEMDGTLAAECATNATLTLPPLVNFGMALARLPGAHWSALTPTGPLRAHRLLEVRDERCITTSRLDIDERVLHFLAGVNYLDPRLSALLREQIAVGTLAATHERAMERVLDTLDANEPLHAVQLIGNDTPAQIEIARRLAARRGLRLHVLRAGDIPASPHEVDALATLWSREAQLLRSALLVQVEDTDAKGTARLLERVRGLAIVGSRQPVPGVVSSCHEVRRLEASEQRQLWQELLGESASALNGSLDALASQFRLNSAEIVSTARELRASPAQRDDYSKALWHACREVARRRLDDLAQRVEPMATWSDLVLPDQQCATLREIAAHVRQRTKVYEEWGFSTKGVRGLGISVLFSGESGTGKTMAAEVLANELHLDLYRIDLSSMVSKYIGETEKNLRRVFDAAEDSGAILLFDEADALFGKRSEVNDSHDRYANIEVSYLLQRMEAYRGLAILTTNFKSALDGAFLRRLRFIVQFPFPDNELRQRIWRGAFPSGVPMGGIDHHKLAQLNVAGGNIRNIAMNAAFLAAEADTPLGMTHLLQAARSEATKRERPFSDAETRGWI